MKNETVVVLAAGVAALFYLLQWPASYVGSFNDDASYVLAAQSVGQGRYVQLQEPHTPRLTQYPPGYPLFLAPFSYFAAPPWTVLRLTSIALLLLSAFLLWFLLKGVMSPWLRALLCAGLLLNPQTVRLSSAVMSEPLYLCLSLLTFLMFRRALEKDSPPWVAWVLGLTLGWASIVRTVGIVLIPAIGISLVYSQRWRTLLRVLPLALAPSFLFFIANAQQTGQLTSHSGLLQSMWARLSADGIGLWLDHLHRSGYIFLVRGFLGWSFPYTEWGVVVSLGLIALLLISAGVGARQLLREKAVPRPLAVAFLLYALGYAAVFACWTALDGRFVLPLLPFLALLILKGWHAGAARTVRPQWIMALAAVMLIGAYVGQNIHTLSTRSVQKETSLSAFPARSLEWIQQHLPPESYLLSGKPAVIYLYTQRHGCSSPVANDVEEFRYRVLQRGITHAWYQPIVGKGVRGYSPAVWSNQKWIAGWPAAFEIVYSNPDEHVLVYKVIPDPAYEKAYGQFLSAQRYLENKEVDKGRAELAATLQHYPFLASAHNAYGELLLSEKNNAQAGERYFKKAVALRPYYPLALCNLARVYHQKGQNDLARQTYEQALAAIPISGESFSLAPQIQREIAAL